MMNDKLENYIHENRISFDDLTPPNELWEKISQKNSNSKNYSIKRIIYRASGVAAIFIVAIMSYTYFFNSPAKQNFLSEFNNEIQETERYYTNKVLSKKNEVFKLTSSQPEIKQDIEAELAILDTAMIELKNDLNENIANTEVVEAMIQNYRMKLQILEDILIYLEPTKKEKTNSNTSKI